MKTETQTKHTPGPWKSEGREIESTRGHRVEYVHSTNADGIIAQVWTPSDANTEKRAANARLIASAPDLLEVCKTLLESYCAERAKLPPCDVSQADAAEAVRVKRAARAAIIKAEGGAA